MINKKQNKEIKFCPKCGSENIGFEIADGINHNYCKNCGFNDRHKQGIYANIEFPIKQKLTKKK